MAQVDEYTVPSTSPLTMTALKAALDAMFAAAVTCNRGVDGAAEPQVGMLQWFTSAETETLKVYASDGWKSILFFNTSTGAITFYGNTDGTALYSAFIRTLLDDASASAALTTLGFSEFAKNLIDDASASTALSTLGVTAFAKTILDDANASAVLSTVGFSAFVKTLIAAADADAFKTLIEVTGGSSFYQASLTERSTSEFGYTKLKDINCPLAGTYDVRFELKSAVNEYCYAKIYVNGDARGTERVNTTATYLFFTEKITVTAGQNIQLYARTRSGGNPCYVRNFSVQLCDSSMTVVTD